MVAPRNVQHLTPERRETPAPAATIDACGLTCGSLEAMIAKHLRALAPGEVIEIRSDREEAADGIAAWVRLAGHTLVTVETDQASRQARYFVLKKTPPR